MEIPDYGIRLEFNAIQVFSSSAGEVMVLLEKGKQCFLLGIHYNNTGAFV